MGSILPCNIVGLISNVSEEVATITISWLGSVVIKVSDLRSTGHEFDSRSALLGEYLDG